MQKQEALKLALHYAQLGIRTIPIRFGDVDDKAPLVGKGGFHNASTNGDDIRHMFENVRNDVDCGLAIYPGPDGYVVLDVDVKDGKTGLVELEALKWKFGELPLTAVGRTGSGGLHYFFKKPVDDLVGNVKLPNCPSIDIRGDEGYVVAPGSYAADGRKWEWLDGKELDKVAEWPDWLAERLSGTGAAKRQSIEDVDTTKLDELTVAMYERFKELGGHLAVMRKGTEWDKEEYYVEIAAPSYNVQHVSATIGYIGPGVAKVWAEHWETPDGKVFPMSARYNNSELNEFLNGTTHEHQGPTLRVKERTTKLADLVLDLDGIESLEPPTYLIDKYLVRSSLAAVASDPGVGKSFLAIDWAMSIATGRDWQGLKVQKGKVLYIAAEGAAGFGKRTRAWRQYHKVSKEEIQQNFRVIPFAVNLTTVDQLNELEEYIATYQPDLLVIDTYARSTVSGDENATRDTNIIVDHLDQLKRASDACVLVLSHVGHMDKTRMRGSTALIGALDTSMLLKSSKGATAFTLEVQKQKDDEAAHPMGLKRSKFYLEDSEESSCVIVSATQEDDLTEDAPRLTPVQQGLVDALKAIHISGGVSSSAWKEQVQKQSGLSPGAFYRHVADLVAMDKVKSNGMEGRNKRYWAAEELTGLVLNFNEREAR